MTHHTPRVLIASFFHETHSFLPEPTTMQDFRIRLGDELLDHAGDGGCVDGFLEVAAAEGWQVIPTADYAAKPAGIIENDVFESFWGELNRRLRRALQDAPLDAVLMALHGAALTTAFDDLEGELLSRLRAIPEVADLPIVACFDLHANFTDAMAAHATALVGYRENPHIDVRDTAVRAAGMISRILREGERPRMYALRAPLIWPPTGTGTADSPMRQLEAAARRVEAEVSGIWACNVIGGFSFSDVPDAGVAFSVVTTGTEAAARAALVSLAEVAITLRQDGLPSEWDLDAALIEAAGRPGGPWLIVEPADNIGGGGPGDCTSVLRGLIRHGIGNALVVLADPEAVAALTDARPGEVRRLAIGGKRSPLDPGPVELDLTFVSRSDGRFRLEDRNSHMIAAQGENIRMGDCAVVTAAPGITILLTSLKTSPNDLGQLRSQGIEPTEFAIIGIKGAVAWRRAYDSIAAGTFIVDTPGPTTSNLFSLPYRHLRRPIWPLDALTEAELVRIARAEGPALRTEAG